MVEFGHIRPLLKAPRRSLPVDERLLEVAAAYQQLHGGLLDEREAFACAGRAYLVVLVGSILLWVLIGLAVFELFVALTG
jgi:hypothetical protein